MSDCRRAKKKQWRELKEMVCEVRERHAKCSYLHFDGHVLLTLVCGRSNYLRITSVLQFSTAFYPRQLAQFRYIFIRLIQFAYIYIELYLKFIYCINYTVYEFPLKAY